MSCASPSGMGLRVALAGASSMCPTSVRLPVQSRGKMCSSIRGGACCIHTGPLVLSIHVKQKTCIWHSMLPGVSVPTCPPDVCMLQGMNYKPTAACYTFLYVLGVRAKKGGVPNSCSCTRIQHHIHLHCWFQSLL